MERTAKITASVTGENAEVCMEGYIPDILSLAFNVIRRAYFCQDEACRGEIKQMCVDLVTSEDSPLWDEEPEEGLIETRIEMPITNKEDDEA